MQETITITLPDDLRKALDEAACREGLPSNELISEALKEYLYFRRLRSLRERMITKAKEQGICTDQDVFDQVS